MGYHFRRSAAASNNGFSSPTAYAVGYYLPPLRGCEQQRLLLPPRLTPWAWSLYISERANENLRPRPLGGEVDRNPRFHQRGRAG